MGKITFDRLRNRSPDVSLWGDTEFENTDIRQGQIGDCYFLTALSALAEWDDRLRGVFYTRSSSYP